MNRHDLGIGPDARLVLHGHYRDWFSTYRPATPTDGRLVYFGLLKEYKGVPELLAAFGDVDDADLALHVVGRPVVPDVERAVRALGAADGRVTLTLRYVADAELARLITGAEAVVLPYVEMGNSGAALLALSLDRPIIVPRAPGNTELAAEVGLGWVVEYEPPLSSTKLVTALEDLRRTARTHRPDLDERNWADIGDRLLGCYREASRSSG
jgi:beta-1,4-mannosyltransferase